MPKQASWRVAWSTTQQTYQIEETDTHTLREIVPESPAWFAWLDQISSFAFWGKTAHYTARKEQKLRGAGYWYAYLGAGHKLRKRYLGKGDALTPTRLEQAARDLLARSGQGAASRPERRGGPASVGTKASALRTSPTEGRDTDTAYPEFQQMDAPESPHPLHMSKLRIPRPRAALVPRPHLVERLRQGMGGPLTLLSAPAGFGKTTVLTEWLAQSGTAGAWLTLEPEDNEPVRFFTYLLAALQRLYPALGNGARALLDAPQPLPIERVLALLTNELLASATEDFALVLDDYHVIEAEAVHQGIAFLLDRLPPQMHMVLATRADPPLHLARLRARGQLVELRAADLRFDGGETAAFLQTVMGIDLSASDLATLVQRTEGWIAGLQLAGLSLQGRPDPTAFLAAFTGSHRFVLDYLSEEVFSRQPVAVQQFLLQSSILERLSGPLCDAVTGQEDSQARLEGLERDNLFLVALDDERRWYRYHHLLRDVLRSRLQQEQAPLVPELHRRASTWYGRHGMVAEAISHLLSAGDVEQVAAVIESQGFALTVRTGGRIEALHGWLAALPEPLVRTRPTLCLLQAVTLMFFNRPHEAEALLHEAERSIRVDMSAEEARLLRGYAATIQANLAGFAGDVVQAVAFAEQAQELLPDTDMIMRPVARMVLAHRFYLDGDVTAANEHLILEAAASARRGGNRVIALNVLTALARLQFMQGKLRQAAATYGQVAEMIPDPAALQAMPGSASYYFGLGDILREWNELAEAERLLLESIGQVAGTVAVPREVVTQGYVSLARVQMAQGEYQAALNTLRAFARVARAQQFLPAQEAQGTATAAQVELALGTIAEAVRWAETTRFAFEENELSYPREREYLALVRVYIAQGRRDPAGPLLQQALRMLDRLLADAEAKGRVGSTLEALALRALALHAQAHQEQALATLERAVALAEPEGYVRVFADEGMPMAVLLVTLLARRRGSADYLRTLRAACEPSPTQLAVVSGRAASAGHAGTALLLPDTLSTREREVLQLVAAGVSNAEIAERLVIEVSTVKRHMSNIFAKLGASNRTQAAAHARALGVLP